MSPSPKQRIENLKLWLTNVLKEKETTIKTYTHHINEGLSCTDPPIEAIFLYIEDISSINWEQVPSSVFEATSDHSSNLINNINELSEFDLYIEDQPKRAWDNIIDSITSSYEELFAVSSRDVFLQKLREYDKSGEKLTEKDFTKAKEDITRARKLLLQMEGLGSAAKQTASEVGVGRFSGIFGDDATKHSTRAKKWLWASGILAIVTAIISLVFFGISFPKNELFGLTIGGNTEGVDKIPYISIVPRIVTLSIFYLAVIVSLKNYRIHRHLFITNRHRQNALDSFATFYESGKSDAVKDAVLLEATSCIFTHIASGYLGKDDDTTQSPLVRILDMVKKETPG